MKDRLATLSALTRGATLIALSTGAVAACTKGEPASAPSGTTSSAETTSAGDADAGVDAAATFHRRFPVPNALPRYRLRRDGGAVDGGPDDAP